MDYIPLFLIGVIVACLVGMVWISITEKRERWREHDPIDITNAWVWHKHLPR